jgi:hypothetical protein
MPFELQTQGRIIRFNLIGRVTREDIASAVAAVEEIEAGRPDAPDRLVDLRGMTELAAGHEVIQAVAKQRRESRFANHFKSAFIAGNALQMGYARMFQTLNDNPSITVRIFSDEPAAAQWLSED